MSDWIEAAAESVSRLVHECAPADVPSNHDIAERIRRHAPPPSLHSADPRPTDEEPDEREFMCNVCGRVGTNSSNHDKNCPRYVAPCPAAVDIDALQKLYDASTAGPFIASRNTATQEVTIDALRRDSMSEVVARFKWFRSYDDVEFFTQVHNAMPQLLAEVRELRAGQAEEKEKADAAFDFAKASADYQAELLSRIQDTEGDRDEARFQLAASQERERRLRELRDQIWKESQAGSCIIRDAGIMQSICERIDAALASPAPRKE